MDINISNEKGYTFKLIFDKNYIKDRKKLIRKIKIMNFIILIKKILGIYDVIETEVINDPVVTKEGFEYSLKVKKVRKYFLYINYGSRAGYNNK